MLRVINLFLRGLVVLSKFLLIFCVSKFGTLEELGKFSLFQTTILLSTFIVGFDFYNFTHRAYSKSGDKSVFIEQLFTYISIYLLSLPFIIIFSEKYVNIHFVFFFTILIAEHYSQEIYRVLILLNKQLVANIFYFFRTALWVYVYLTLIIFKIISFTFKELIFFWTMFSLANIVVSAVIFFYIILNKKIELLPLNRLTSSFVKGIKVSSIFFLTTILFKLLEYQYRYFLEIKWNSKAVGIYSFIQSIASIYITILDVFFFSFTYSYIMNTEKRNREKWINNAKQTILVWGLCIISIIIFFMKYMGAIIGKPEISSYSIEFSIILFGNFFYNVSLIYHYLLYVDNKDFAILKSTMLSFVITIIVSFAIIPFFGVLGAAVSYLVGFFFLFVYKRKYYHNYAHLPKV